MTTLKAKGWPFEYDIEAIRKIDSKNLFDEIERSGLISLKPLHKTQKSKNHDAGFVDRPRRWSETDMPFLVDQLADNIPFKRDMDIDRKIISVRFAVCFARDQARTAFGNMRSLFEAQLQLKKTIGEIRLLCKNNNFDMLRRSYFSLRIDMYLTEIDRCQHFLRQMSSRFQILDKNIGFTPSEPRKLLPFCNQLERQLSKLPGANAHLQKRVFISCLVRWWEATTGKMPAKKRRDVSFRNKDTLQIDFYQFLEFARQDAGLTNVLPAPADQSGPFERMVREVITDLQKPSSGRVRGLWRPPSVKPL